MRKNILSCVLGAVAGILLGILFVVIAFIWYLL